MLVGVALAMLLAACGHAAERATTLPAASPSPVAASPALPTPTLHGPATGSASPAGGTPRATAASSASPSSGSGVDVRSAAAVEAAVRGYFEAVNVATTKTHDTADIERRVSKSCPCSNIAKTIREDARAGSWAHDALYSIESVRVHDLTRSTAGATAAYAFSAYHIVNSKGETEGQWPARHGHIDFSLILHQGDWILTNAFVLDQT